MALIVSKTAAKVIPKSSTYLKSTIKSITINRNWVNLATALYYYCFSINRRTTMTLERRESVVAWLYVGGGGALATVNPPDRFTTYYQTN